MKKGFTLIELLVVVAILGILMSILLPSLSKARLKAKAAVCLSNLKQQGVAYNLYMTDTGMIKAANVFNGHGDYPHESTNNINYIKIYLELDSLFCPLNSITKEDYRDPWVSEYIYVAYPERNGRKGEEGENVILSDVSFMTTANINNGSDYFGFKTDYFHQNTLWLDGSAKNLSLEKLNYILWQRTVW